ncbi:MAG: LacI family DNA-binding transcriptional regulator [Eisenbergiella massiliensis]
MKKVLIQDIANELGLSRNTVSKALKNDEIVLEETRKRVIRKAREMGYQKLDPIFRQDIQEERPQSVAANKKYAILMSSFAEDDFWNGVVLGITERIKQENGSCLLVIASYEDDDNMIIPSALLTEKIEGIVCLTLFSREYEKKICELGIPVVFMDSPVLRIPYRHEHDRIILEGAQSVYALTMDLIKRGCEKVGFIGDITYCESIFDRFRGYRLALEDAGKEVDEHFTLTEANKAHYYSDEMIEKKAG